jgi:hypothetical protein
VLHLGALGDLLRGRIAGLERRVVRDSASVFLCGRVFMSVWMYFVCIIYVLCMYVCMFELQLSALGDILRSVVWFVVVVSLLLQRSDQSDTDPSESKKDI